MIVRELVTRLGFSLNNAQLQNAERATDRVRDRAEAAAAAFRNIVTAVASLASVRAIINIADEMQSMRSRVADLPQTIGEAGAAFDTVAAHANEAGQSIDAYGKLYTRIGHAAKDYISTQEDLLSITDTISKALTVGGANTQEASATMIQFSQALGSGVLQGDEFRSMAEAAPQYLDQLSLAMNIPREKLKAMASEGKLTSREVIEATRKMAGYFEERFKNIPMTVGRATQIVGNRFALMIDRMNRESMFVTRIANFILAGFDKIEAGINKVLDAFGGFSNMARFIGIALGVAFGAKALAILSAFRVASLLALLPFIKIIAIVSAVALVLEDLYVWIQGGDSITGALLGPWEQWRPYVMGAIEMVSDALKWFWRLLTVIGGVIAGLFTLNPELFKGSLNQLGTMLWAKLSEWGMAIYNAFFSPIVNAVSDAWDKVTGIVRKALSFDFSAVMERGQRTARNATGALVTGAALAAGPSTVAGTTGAPGTLTPPVAPAQLTGAAMGTGGTTVQSNTTVNVTVPPGTPGEQAQFVKNAAQVSFSEMSRGKLARDMSVYSR